MAENRTRVDCLEGSHANHYTTIAMLLQKNLLDHWLRAIQERRLLLLQTAVIGKWLTTNLSDGGHAVYLIYRTGYKKGPTV